MGSEMTLDVICCKSPLRKKSQTSQGQQTTQYVCVLVVGAVTITWPKTFIRAMVFHSVWAAGERWRLLDWAGDQYKGSTNIPRLLRDTSHTIPLTIPFPAWRDAVLEGNPRRSNNKQLSLLLFWASIIHEAASDQWYRTKESIRDCCNDGDEGLTFHSSFEPAVQKIFVGRIKV